MKMTRTKAIIIFIFLFFLVFGYPIYLFFKFLASRGMLAHDHLGATIILCILGLPVILSIIVAFFGEISIRKERAQKKPPLIGS